MRNKRGETVVAMIVFSTLVAVVAVIALATSIFYSPNKGSDMATETKETVEVTEEVEKDPLLEVLTKDPEGMYLVKEPWIREVGGFCVEREGELYSLTAFVPIDNILRYKVGYNIEAGSPNAALFMQDEKASEIPTDEPFCCITAGDIPILKVHKNELIRGYNVDSLGLFKTEFVGWTIDVAEKSEGLFPIINYNFNKADEEKAKSLKTNFGVFETISGKPAVDFRHLNYGEDYIFSWENESEGHIEKKLAECKAFRSFDPSNKPEPIIITGKPGKNGYAEFSVADLPTGTYLVADTAAVFEIID